MSIRGVITSLLLAIPIQMIFKYNIQVLLAVEILRRPQNLIVGYEVWRGYTLDLAVQSRAIAPFLS